MFNATLLSKLDWKLLLDNSTSWYPLLAFKYRYIKGQNVGLFVDCAKKKILYLMKDLRDLLCVGGGEENWFGNIFACKLGNGSKIDFWRNRWIWIVLLMQQCPILFDLGKASRQSIGASGQWLNGIWH